MAWYKSAKLWSFVGGVAAATVAQVAAKSPCVRKAAVTATSKVMLANENAQAAMQSIKDDAEDMCADARAEAKQKAEDAELEAKIEEKVRAEFEAAKAKAADEEA